MMMYIIIGIACLVGIIVVVLLLPNSGKQQQKGQKYRFELSAGGGRKITFADPFDNFLVYGGANSGKTKSIGKPLLSQYIQAGFAGFVYNYKDFDLARTAVHLVKKHNYPYGCFQISFTDMERTHRTNPIRPSVVKNETLFLQLMDDMLTAYQGKDGKRDEWFNGALGILRGVSIRMQGEMLELAAKECTRSDVFTGQEAYGEYTNVLNKIMEESVLSFDLIRTIISPSVSMTDGERIKIIVDLDNKLKENRDKMLDERARFNTVNDAIKRIAALKSTAKK